MGHIKAKNADGTNFYMYSTKPGTLADPALSQESIVDRLDTLNTVVGQTSSTEASSNTGTFPLISLLKRLLNTTLAALPVSRGSKASADSLAVVLASDQVRRTVSMVPINLSAVSGDQTIFTPTAGKSLQIFNVVLSNSTTATAFILKQGTTGEGQLNLTGTITAFDAALDFPEPLGLAINRSFVINLPSSGTLRGYVTLREE